MNNIIEEIHRKFIHNAQENIYFFITKQGYFIPITKAKIWCLANFKKKLKDAGGEELPLFKALTDEIEQRRLRGEIPPLEQ